MKWRIFFAWLSPLQTHIYMDQVIQILLLFTLGDTVAYFSQNAYIYNTTFISLLDTNYMIFRVATCQGAHVALSDIPDNVLVHTYEVVLGAHDNKMVRSSIVVAALLLTNLTNKFHVAWEIINNMRWSFKTLRFKQFCRWRFEMPFLGEMFSIFIENSRNFVCGFPRDNNLALA